MKKKTRNYSGLICSARIGLKEMGAGSPNNDRIFIWVLVEDFSLLSYHDKATLLFTVDAYP